MVSTRQSDVKLLIIGNQYQLLKQRSKNIMNTGTVKWFNATKGYGFVEPSDKSKDVFLHISALEAIGLSDLQDGQKISYNIESNKGKISAIDIKLI